MMLLSILWSLTASFPGQPKLTPQLKSAFTAAEAMRRELVSLRLASLLHETLSVAPFDTGGGQTEAAGGQGEREGGGDEGTNR